MKIQNQEANHYDYRAEILQNKNKGFVVYDITEISSNLLNNSIPLWIYNKDRLNIPVYPSYLSPLNLETPYLSVEVIDTKGLSMPRHSALQPPPAHQNSAGWSSCGELLLSIAPVRGQRLRHLHT